ncbi:MULTISPECIES: helix-turn-helix domain-containing protein [unclassified Caballeronia]|uniref:helix-turn-helix domain-containing protein n=1 Tax=unclassified Caballeronia TaxID=2646786 RepID=UPI00158A742C|nr:MULTISPECIES: helix-turn-helix domain-containing protein [unclassified Caballeronia]QSN63465.1 helix-turn-helix domain-containing protein [Caballeronia sp. M1242]
MAYTQSDTHHWQVTTLTNSKIPTPAEADTMALAHKRLEGADDFMSIAESARLLFVSRSQVVKLAEQGKLKLHHKTGSNLFVVKASVLGYQADHQAAMRA